MKVKAIDVVIYPVNDMACIEDIDGNYLWLHQRKDGAWG